MKNIAVFFGEQLLIDLSDDLNNSRLEAV